MQRIAILEDPQRDHGEGKSNPASIFFGEMQPNTDRHYEEQHKIYGWEGDTHNLVRGFLEERMPNKKTNHGIKYIACGGYWKQLLTTE